MNRSQETEWQYSKHEQISRLMLCLVRLTNYEAPRSFSFLAFERGPAKTKNWINRTSATPKAAPEVISRITSGVWYVSKRGLPATPEKATTPMHATMTAIAA